MILNKPYFSQKPKKSCLNKKNTIDFDKFCVKDGFWGSLMFGKNIQPIPQKCALVTCFYMKK